MGWIREIWNTLIGIQPTTHTEMSLEAHCQSVKPWLVAEARKLSRRRNNAAYNHVALSNIDNLLPDNLMLKSASIDPNTGDITIVAQDYMKSGGLFAITVKIGSREIVVQQARQAGGSRAE